MSDASVPKPPADLWSRLAQINKHCDVRLSSEPEPAPDGSWRWLCTVLVRRRDADPAEEAVLIRAESAVAALVNAIREVEARGWIGPEPA